MFSVYRFILKTLTQYKNCSPPFLLRRTRTRLEIGVPSRKKLWNLWNLSISRLLPQRLPTFLHRSPRTQAQAPWCPRQTPPAPCPSHPPPHPLPTPARPALACQRPPDLLASFQTAERLRTAFPPRVCSRAASFIARYLTGLRTQPDREGSRCQARPRPSLHIQG